MRSPGGASSAAAYIGAARFLAGTASLAWPITRSRPGFCASASTVARCNNKLRLFFMGHSRDRKLSASFFSDRPCVPPCASWLCCSFCHGRCRFSCRLCQTYSRSPRPDAQLPSYWCLASRSPPRCVQLFVSVLMYISFCFL
jgi:hypothetical protein